MIEVAFQKSTIVRASRPLFSTLEAVAPGPGSVLAERMWCYVPRAKAGRAAPVAKAGERFTVRVNGRDVAAEAWGDGPIVYLTHGWGGWRTQLDRFVHPLLWTGHRVVTFDAPSHGDSAPGAFGAGRGLLNEFSEALTAVAAVTGPAHAVVAHSLGATATALAVLDGLPASRLVLISPMADPIPYTIEFAQAFGFGEKIRQAFLRRLELRVGRRMIHFSVPARARAHQSPLPAALIVHDRQDKQMHYSDGETIAAAWPGAELMTTTGLGHLRILHDSEVIDRAVAHITARVPA